MSEDWADEMRGLAARYRMLREKKGLSQIEAAQETGVSIGSVQNFELLKVGPLAKSIGKFRVQISKWERELGPTVLATLVREAVKPYGAMATLFCNFQCQGCGRMVPGPDEALTEAQPLWCCWCGEKLARVCPNCHTVETRLSSHFCRTCGTALTLQGMQEAKKGKRDADD